MTEPEQQQPTFEQALTTLEAIVRDMEQGTLGLAESLGKYEEGVKLLTQCQQLLDRAERRIELLTGVTASGEPITQPFADTPTADESGTSGTKSRSRKRSTPARGKATGGDSADCADQESPSSGRSAIDDTRPLF
jgi:exodeoxyribonuclease VII small subunit